MTTKRHAPSAVSVQNGSDITIARQSGDATNSLQPALTELTRCFIEYRVWFNQKLPPPVITIQNSGRKAARAWYSNERWEQAHLGNPLDEINICAEYLAEDVHEIAHSMIHEMVHYANHQLGNCDCNANQYHNRHFKVLAEHVGLHCGNERHRRYGWGFTSLTDVARRRIDDIDLNRDAFSLFRQRDREYRETGKAEPKLLKWTCDCDSVWRGAKRPPLQAICMCCGQQYRLR